MCSRISAAGGAGANVSISGSSSRKPASISFASASLPSTAPSMTTILRPRRNSGMSGSGGICSSRADALTESGAVRAHST
jgi:hypothetical protein